MVSPVPGNPSMNEQTAVPEQAFGFQASARTAGRNLRNVGFQLIALLLGIALAFL